MADHSHPSHKMFPDNVAMWQCGPIKNRRPGLKSGFATIKAIIKLGFTKACIRKETRFCKISPSEFYSVKFNMPFKLRLCKIYPFKFCAFKIRMPPESGVLKMSQPLKNRLLKSGMTHKHGPGKPCRTFKHIAVFRIPERPWKTGEFRACKRHGRRKNKAFKINRLLKIKIGKVNFLSYRNTIMLNQKITIYKRLTLIKNL